MYSRKLTCLLVIVTAHLGNAQFGGFGGFGGGFGGGLSAGGLNSGFANQNTNFQQNSGSSFGTIASFGSRGQNTNFQQSSNRGGIGAFGLNSGLGFRQDGTDLEEEEMEMSHMRYASPYDIPTYVPKKPAAYPPHPAYPAPKPYAPAAPVPAYNAPAPAYNAPVPAYNAPAYKYPVQCPQNLLIGCAPKVQYVPCGAY